MAQIPDEDDRRLRGALVATVAERIGGVAPRFRDALLSVDRARFVRAVDLASAWIDEPLPLDTPYGNQVATVSAPHAYVLGFDALDLSTGDRLLELGSGSGYGAALASHVVGTSGRVTTVEVDPYLARIALRLTADLPNVFPLHDDGLQRPDLIAQHDKCWLTFSVEAVPPSLLAAMREGSVLVAPVGSTLEQRLARYVRRNGKIEADDLGAVRFVRARARIDE